MLKFIKPSPNKLWIAVTNACNICCAHCLIKAGKKLENELSTKEIYRIVKEAGDLGVKRIAFTGGEPLLRPDILNLIKYTSSFKIRTYLETNGALLTDNLIHKLKISGLKILNLSLDAPTPELHDKIRGKKGLFEKVIQAINKAIEIGLDVRVYCAVSLQNIDTAKEIPKLFTHLFRKLGVLTYAYFMPLGRGRLELAVPSLQWKSFCREIDKLIELYKDKIPMRYEPTFLTKDEFHELQKQLPYNISCLARERDWIYVSPQGKVYGCVLLVNTNMTLGNIRNQKLVDIWLNSKNWSFFDSANKGCKALTFQIQNKLISCLKYDKLNKNLIPICPLAQYPKIEPWPYEYKMIE